MQMASRYEVKVTITSAKDLKNVNWRHGPLNPYAVVWVDSNSKCSTFIDEEGDTCPIWNQTLVIPFNAPIDDSVLHVDIVHANAAADTKPLIGSSKLPLRNVVDEFRIGIGAKSTQQKLELKRPSGRPHGKLELTVSVHEPRSYPPPYAAAPPPSYGGPYAAPQQAYGGPYVATPPYNYNNYAGQAPNPYSYSGGAPNGQSSSYGYGEYKEEEKKSKNGMGIGTGLVVGAVAGVLGGLALAEGFDYVEDKISDDVAEKVEDDLGDDNYDDGDY